MPEFVYFDWVVVEKVNKLSKKLDLDNFILFVCSRVTWFNFAVVVLVIMFADNWQ